MYVAPTGDKVISRPRAAATAAHSASSCSGVLSGGRLKVTLLASTALLAVATLAPPASAQSCSMQGGACVISTDGIDGTDGNDGQGDMPGFDGKIGTPAGDIGPIDLDDLQDLTSNGTFSPMTITSIGGSGGSGGNAGNTPPLYLDSNRGGNGQPGSDGSTINVNIGDNTSGVATIGPSGQLVDAVTIVSKGGDGGGGGVPTEQEGDQGAGVSAPGGDGQDVTASVGGTWTSQSRNGLYAASLGGRGGEGKDTNVTLAKDGTPGGNGSDSGDVNVTINGDLTGLAYGARVLSAGGNGGGGGAGLNEAGASGGDGGNAGNAGNATATLSAGATVLSTDANAAALIVGSYGGAGGAGGAGSDAGDAGAGANAGNASATVNGSAFTSGLGDSYGVLVQSIGGVGGDGGQSGAWFNPTNGNGNQGGTAGTVMITGTGGAVIQTGTAQNDGARESAVVAQSIGGGGGVGPSSQDGWFAVGGNGGDGSSGNTASASLTNSSVVTYGFASSGIVAQSIGGGGGTGGDATNSDGAIVNMVVGGTGGSGGGAADAFAANQGNGSVTTLNDHAQGVVMQSIGGGGGAGGAGYGKSVSGFFGASISVGGAGGSGGTAGTVNASQANNNSGGIQTTGAESFGILGQSIGGGGGSGGASTAKSIVQSGGDVPGISLSLATGGTAGGGGSASAVYLQNSGLITTAGNGAAGMLGQAIGGGGGTGGDADGSSSASGGGFDFSATVSHGGNGGGAGNGGDVTATSSGLIITRGESADGMLVQSIGGGGGAGGAGDALSSASARKSLTVEIGLGGKSNGGGEGFNVSATNTGAILTLGDGSHGILAQTIGGGGGRGGGGAASNSGTIGLGAAIGAKGGNGGDTFFNGSNSQVTNSGTIVTFGADAGGILAQSIGGGGGAGGKAGTSLGSSTSNNDGSNGSDGNYSATVGSIVAGVKNDYSDDVAAFKDLETLLVTANSFLGANNPRSNTIQYLDDTAGSGGSIDLSNVSTTNTLTVAVGGSGGEGGAGGDITVTNTGSVATMGLLSDAIVVQSIGGGGGKGGAAATSQTENWKSPGISSGVGVGGSSQGSSNDPNATNGAQASITNSGEIITVGALANGLVAQSVGMGGGIGGSTTATTVDANGNATLGFAVTLGGSSQAANGISEAASVTSSGAITTLGHDSYGIIAQSVSGGGGIVKTVAANLDFANGSAVSAASKDFSADISLGTDDPVESRFSGAALVQTTTGGTIVTSGDNGIGILAQSVAGGGGLALGGKPNGTSAIELIGIGGKLGSVNPGLNPNPDANTGVIVEVGDDITTSGKGGVGVFAQSVGGGGGIAGDIGWTMQTQTMGAYYDYAGDGGNVRVTVDAGATITTTGMNAAGIIAQSVGGGGGWIANKSGAFVGSAGGTGDGYPVIVSIQGAVDAQGQASPGIFAQSTGGGDNGGSGSGSQISITVGSPTNSAASVWGGSFFGDAAAAVYFANGGTVDFPNQLTNYGTIATHDTTAGTAVYGNGPYFAGSNWGTITGNVHLAHGNITNYGSGTINPYSTVDLGGDGLFTNAGRVDPGGRGRILTTTVMGSYAQTSGGRLALDADHAKKRSDRLEVTGDVALAGTVRITSPTLTRDPLTIVAAAGEVTLDPELAFDRTHVLSYTAKVADGAVLAAPKADFHATDGSLAGNRQAVARHLQSVLDRGEPGFGEGMAGLAADRDAGSYQDRLDSLTGETLAALGGLQMQAGRGFRRGLFSCPTFAGEGTLLQERDCGWGRVSGSYTDQQGSGSNLGYDVKALTTQFGGQKEIADGWFVGGSLAYQRSDLESDHNLTDIDGDGVLAGLVVKRQTGPLTLSAAADGGYGWYDSRRRIDLATATENAKASPTAGNAGLHARASYEVPFQRWYLKPSFELSADYVRTDGFSEDGASPFDLDVDSEDKVIFSATPQIELGGRIDLPGGSILRPHLELGVTAATANNWQPDARFKDETGGDSFEIESRNPNLIGHLGLGIDMITTAAVDVKLQYDLDVADGYTANAGMLKVGYRF